MAPTLVAVPLSVRTPLVLVAVPLLMHPSVALAAVPPLLLRLTVMPPSRCGIGVVAVPLRVVAVPP